MHTWGHKTHLSLTHTWISHLRGTSVRSWLLPELWVATVPASPSRRSSLPIMCGWVTGRPGRGLSRGAGAPHLLSLAGVAACYLIMLAHYFSIFCYFVKFLMTPHHIAAFALTIMCGSFSFSSLFPLIYTTNCFMLVFFFVYLDLIFILLVSSIASFSSEFWNPSLSVFLYVVWQSELDMCVWIFIFLISSQINSIYLVFRLSLTFSIESVSYFPFPPSTSLYISFYP